MKKIGAEMKTSLLAGLALFASCLLVLSTFTFAQNRTVVDANNQFACELYLRNKSGDSNIFFSPFSISSAMAMVYEGARGETAEEIQSVFHFSKDYFQHKQSFSGMNNLFNNRNKGYTLCVANALWAQKDFPFSEGYIYQIKNFYQGEITSLDFKEQTEQSRLTINSWVEEQTNNRIRDLIPRGSLDTLTRLVITNAIYFKGDWSNQFDEGNTKVEDFRVGLFHIVKTPMMHLDGVEFLYGETDKLQILELPYKGEDLTMLILLPRNDDLKTVEASLSVNNLAGWNKLLNSAQIILSLPKFKMENEYFMKDVLRRMGISKAFSEGIDFGGEADLSGMTGKRDLNIDEVIHKAFVEVNEKGTEAAAVTALEVYEATAADGGGRPVVKVFKADHPFVFIIQHRSTGIILFMGRVSDPTK